MKNLKNRYHKLKIVRQFEAEFGLIVWDPQTPTKVEMEDSFYKLCRTVFRIHLEKPTTADEVTKFYASLVKRATCRKFINIKRGEIRINTDFVTEHLELNSHKNVNKVSFSPQAVEHFGIEVGGFDAYMSDVASLGLDVC